MNTLEEQARLEGITPLQLNAIMGSLLGDGNVTQNSRVSGYVRWNHGGKQEAYVRAKYTLLQELTTRPPVMKPNPGYGDTWCCLATKSLGTFLSLRQMLFPEDSKIKRVTEEYLSHITHPIALAWLWMDDGYRAKDQNVGTLHTSGFLKEDVEIFIDSSVKRFPSVYPAVGSANSAIELTPEELFEISHALRWVDVCKIPEE